MTTTLQHIRLTLAREPDHPLGDPTTGYDIVAFLDGDGRLDPRASKAEPARCRVRRFEQDVTVATGRLRHSAGHRWILDLDGDGSEDVTGFRLEEERFVLGEYVSFANAGGETHTYRVDRLTEA